jgi:hypothetical protein
LKYTTQGWLCAKQKKKPGRKLGGKAPKTPEEGPKPKDQINLTDEESRIMTYRFQTPEGKKLYAKRKHTPEPVFGIIKSVLGFRQFLLQGLDNVKGEWRLVTMAWNMKRMFALLPA